MYNDYVATIEEKVQIALDLSVSIPDLQVRASSAINARIEDIALATGVNASQLTGTAVVQGPAAAPASAASAQPFQPAPASNASADVEGLHREEEHGARRLNGVVQAPLNSSGCDDSQPVILLAISFASSDPAERALFLAKLGNLSFGNIPNVTGTNETGVVCGEMVVSEVARLVTPAPSPPPPPPSLPPLIDVDDDVGIPIPDEVWTFGAIAAVTVLLLGSGLAACWLYTPKSKVKKVKSFAADEERQSLTSVLKKSQGASARFGARPFNARYQGF